MLSTDDTDVTPGEERRPGRRHNARRVGGGCGLIAAVTVLLAIAAVLWLQRTYDHDIHRLHDVFPDGPRPAVAAGHAANWLLLGSDRRSDTGTTGRDARTPAWEPGAQRTDTIMMLHVSASGDRASVISFPRDSWVDIPGHGRAKINAAYSWGGPALLIATIERLTGVRVDHFGILDFRGFVAMTDAVGGVDVNVATPVAHGDLRLAAGVNHLDGGRALEFVRQRDGLPAGDFDRIRRQQAFIRALSTKALSNGTLVNPFRLNALLRAATRSVTVDDGVTAGMLRAMALDLGRSGQVDYLTLPNRGPSTRDGQSVVRIDDAGAARLFDAVRNDRMGAYVSGGENVNRVGRVR